MRMRRWVTVLCLSTSALLAWIPPQAIAETPPEARNEAIWIGIPSKLLKKNERPLATAAGYARSDKVWVRLEDRSFVLVPASEVGTPLYEAVGGEMQGSDGDQKPARIAANRGQRLDLLLSALMATGPLHTTSPGGARSDLTFYIVAAAPMERLDPGIQAEATRRGYGKTDRVGFRCEPPAWTMELISPERIADFLK